MMATTSSSRIESPSLTRISTTLPLCGDFTRISIFMDSSITRVSPSPIDAPSSTNTFQTLPVIGDGTSVISGLLCLFGPLLQLFQLQDSSGFLRRRRLPADIACHPCRLLYQRPVPFRHLAGRQIEIILKANPDIPTQC